MPENPDPPGWNDNVPRRLRYEAEYIEVKISFYGGFFRAIVPGRPEPVIRYDLGRLLDILEALDET
jgi:hypothetical protein